MAFTLEAAIVVPTCLIVFTSVVSLAVPAYMQAETSCYLTAAAADSSKNSSLIYNSYIVEHKDVCTSCVSACPDGLIDICRLGHDLLLPVGDLLKGDDTFGISDE